MLKVGLTGSIAVGKSAVLEVFRELGCKVLDADQTARDVVEPGTPGLKDVVREFGSGIITDGRLDRGKLREIVFDDPERLSILNSIIHPLVFQAQDKWLRACEASQPDGIAMVDAALMIESGGYKRFDKLIVVVCRHDEQVRRLMLRDGITEAEAEKRIALQMPQTEKKRYADFLIDTSNGFEDTREQCLAIFEKLQNEAKATA
jgi:dephospho-CoA kinase